MKYAIGMLCFFASLVLAACSEDADKGSEHYSGVFLSMEAIDAITPEDLFSDVILHNVEFEKEEVGKGEPVEVGGYTMKTETTYDLIMREFEADLYIKTEKRTDKMFEATYVYKYVFKQGTYGVIEVSENAITVNGYPYCKLQKFTLIRTEPIGEKYSKQDVETENYKGIFSCKSNGRNITLSNSDYMFEAVLDGNKCKLMELSPENKNIGILEKQ